MPKVSGYQYSYSGADCKIFAYLEGKSDKIHQIQSMNTISVSVHESKGQARALGYRGIKGVSRGLRTIAGSMILTVIEDHPLRELLVEAADIPDVWSVDRNDKGVGSYNDKVAFTNRIETLLPRFNILATYVSEMGGNSHESISVATDIPLAGWELKGVHITDVGLVTSVHDIVSEMTISFMAEDFYPFSLNRVDSIQYDRDNLQDPVDPTNPLLGYTNDGQPIVQEFSSAGSLDPRNDALMRRGAAGLFAQRRFAENTISIFEDDAAKYLSLNPGYSPNSNYFKR